MPGRGNLSYLEELFPGRLITCVEQFPYHPRSPDMTPPDYFLWEHLKELCFCDPIPRTIDELKAHIIRVISGIRYKTLTSLFDNILTRLEHCVDQHGGHFKINVFYECFTKFTLQQIVEFKSTPPIS